MLRDLASLADVSEFGADYAEQLGLYTTELERLIRRLRALSPGAWRSRCEAVRSAIVELAALGATAVGDPVRAVPPIPDYALADAAAVIGADVRDAAAASSDSAVLALALSVVRGVLDATR